MITLKRILLFIGLKIAELGGLVLGIYLIEKYVVPIAKTPFFNYILDVILAGCLIALIIIFFAANWNYVKKKIK